MTKLADIFIGLIGTVFLWYGLWNLCDLLEEHIGMQDNKIKSSAFFTITGIIMVVFESHKHSFQNLIN